MYVAGLDGVIHEPGPLLLPGVLPCNLLSIYYMPGTMLGAQGSKDEWDLVPGL